MFFLLLAASLPTIAMADTIPCPGYNNPSNFSDVPLTQRPTLARILQHGYHGQGFQALLPSLTEPTPSVSSSNTIDQLFATRPYRTLDNSQCRFASEMIYCVRSAAFTVVVGPSGNLVEDQVLLQLGQRYDDFDLPLAQDMLEPSSFAAWTEQVQDFFNVTGNETDVCRQSTSMFYDGRSHSCAAALSDCATIDPEFKQDLASLPTNDNASSLADYQAFVDKWGQGTVESFKFGTLEWQLYWEGEQEPTLYMGRAGGTANFSQGDYYTEEECTDPLPVELGYTPWEKALDEIFQYDSMDPVVQGMDLMAITNNFFKLRLSYNSLRQQISEQGLDYPICPAVYHKSSTPSSSPSTVPSSAPSSVPTTTTAPTMPTTASPTLRSTTRSSQNLPANTGAPTLPTSDDDDDDDDANTSNGSISFRNEYGVRIALSAVMLALLSLAGY